VTLQIHKAAQLGKHFGTGFEAIGVTERQRRYVKNGSTDGIQDRSAALPHFRFSQRAGHRLFHECSVLGWSKIFNLTQYPHETGIVCPQGCHDRGFLRR